AARAHARAAERVAGADLACAERAEQAPPRTRRSVEAGAAAFPQRQRRRRRRRASPARLAIAPRRCNVALRRQGLSRRPMQPTSAATMTDRAPAPSGNPAGWLNNQPYLLLSLTSL